MSILLMAFQLYFLYAGNQPAVSVTDIDQQFDDRYEMHRGALPVGWVSKEESSELLISQRLSLRLLSVAIDVAFEYNDLLFSFGTSETSAKGHVQPRVYYASEICSRISRFNI